MTGIAPVALADPPDALFQDFNAPQTPGKTFPRYAAANESSASAKDYAVGARHHAVTPSGAATAASASGSASGMQDGQAPHG